MSDQVESIKDLVDVRDEWNLNLMNNIFTHHISDKITTTNPPNEELGEDICNWKGSST